MRKLLPSLVVAAVWTPSLALAGPPVAAAPPPRAFLVHAFNGTLVKNGGKCLDYATETVGAALVIDDCSRAHSFTVEELDVSDADGRIVNHVRLRAGSLVVGVKGASDARGPRGAVFGLGTLADAPLELQNPIASRSIAGLPLRNMQELVLDGDSIMLAANRDLVATVQNGRGKNGTPIVVGPRRLADAEFWDFRATDGSDAEPTSDGFVTIDSWRELFDRFRVGDHFPPNPLLRGTVVRMADLSFDVGAPVEVPAEITLRGDRRGTRLGPELGTTLLGLMLQIQGDRTRITGLRLRGANRNRDKDDIKASSVGIAAPEGYRTIIDHNDGSDFYQTPVRVAGTFKAETEEVCRSRSLTNNVVVARNFFHHNLMDGDGYGVSVKSEAFPLIEGNTFLMNRHAIAMTSSSSGTAYRAWSNLVLARAPQQNPVILEFTQDFDVHGTGDALLSSGFGGVGGYYADIARNTFLGTNRYNFKIRAYPCEYVDFRENVSLHDDQLDAAVFQERPSHVADINDNVIHVQAIPEQFGHSNPTTKLATGDFDGDGLLDLFLATGASWYYAPGGTAEWRLLGGDKRDLVDTLRFGDFDGDGRTDVIGKNGSSVMVSWGGSSDWDVLTTTSAPMTDLAAGDFDGDGIADLFYADGATWWLASGAQLAPGSEAPFALRNTSSFRVKDLLFGDFNGNHRTDVFGVVGGNWAFSDGAERSWYALQPKLTNTVDGLLVADMDGDNREDIVMRTEVGFGLALWQFSLSGLSDMVPIAVATREAAAVGRFRGPGRSDLLLWEGNGLASVAYESPTPTTFARQDMR